MRQIVCLATSPWYPIPTRKQQVMSRIPDAEILYFDPSATIIAPLRDKHAKPLMTKYKETPVHPGLPAAAGAAVFLQKAGDQPHQSEEDRKIHPRKNERARI